MTTMNFKGTTTLITGASSGIGREFARALATNGCNLIITARSLVDLTELAEELESAHPTIWVKVIPLDLSQSTGPQALHTAITDMALSVDYLINNAGFGKWASFTDESLETYHRMQFLNMNALVDLTYLFIPEMMKRNRGGIINVASTAAFQPLPYQAVYGATKSFVLNFTEALSGELLDTDLRVMALCPGVTESNFMTVANADTEGLSSSSASDVVSVALKAFAKNKTYVIPGTENYIKSLVGRFFTRKATIKIVADMFRERIERRRGSASLTDK